MSAIQTNPVITEKEVFIKMALSNWETQNKRLNDLLAKLSDEQLSAETAPGRNTGVYLLGHLAAIHDAMMTILGFNERVNPAMDEIFIHNPDKSGLAKPSAAELRKYLDEVNAALEKHISSMPADEWFTRHNSVSEEDFAKEPHRNKLNIIINRSNHLAYHLGQMAYLQKK